MSERTYAIAAYLTNEQKQRALSTTYDTREARGQPNPRTPNGICPLGMALGGFRPDSRQVRFKIYPSDYAIELAAAEFINDWDAGKIVDLASALGVQP